MVGIFSYGGMPHDLARDNLECFARRVLPVLSGIDTGVVLSPGAVALPGR